MSRTTRVPRAVATIFVNVLAHQTLDTAQFCGWSMRFTYHWYNFFLNLGRKGNEAEEAGEVDLSGVRDIHANDVTMGKEGGVMLTAATSSPMEMVSVARVIVMV